MHRFLAIKRLGAPAFLADAPNAYIHGANRVLNAPMSPQSGRVAGSPRWAFPGQ